MWKSNKKSTPLNFSLNTRDVRRTRRFNLKFLRNGNLISCNHSQAVLCFLVIEINSGTLSFLACPRKKLELLTSLCFSIKHKIRCKLCLNWLILQAEKNAPVSVPSYDNMTLFFWYMSSNVLLSSFPQTLLYFLGTAGVSLPLETRDLRTLRLLYDDTVYPQMFMRL